MKQLILALSVALVGMTPAWAATTVYTDRAAFDLATGGSLSFADFNSGATSNASFAVSGTGVFVNGAGELRGRPTIFGDNMTYTFTSPITAFGGDYDTALGGNGTGLRFTLGGGEVVSQELLAPYDSFWGFVADTPFTTLTVSAGSGFGFAETHTLDNLSFGVAAPVAAVPLPASLGMLLAAIAGAFALQLLPRRRSA